ncbi:hypothetical protein [Phreatobacter sp.]|uniref:hypothetical protein n=1 Tax=Phreatobacter sp. TaxID=1966341 RepID=UPI0025DF434B|nr:hypothetical protein [Phreatobacter sp.]
MTRFAFYALRLLRVAAGFLLALALAAAIVVVFDLNQGRMPDLVAGAVAIGFYTFLAAGLFWPLLLIQFVAEAMRWRALAFHLGLGLLGAVASLAWVYARAPQEAPDPILGDEPSITLTKVLVAVVAGLAGGLVYWFVAGRSAGLQRIERTHP